LPDLRVVPAEALSTGRGSDRTPGLAGAYYRGHFEGAPVLTRIDANVDFDWADRAPDPSLDDDSFSVRWTGEITAPATGRYTLAMRCATQCRVLLGNMPIGHGRSDHETALASGGVTLRKGIAYPIRLELEHEKYDAVAELLWQTPGAGSDEVAEAVAAARAAEAVVLALGLSKHLEGEEMPIRIEGFAGGDRTSLDLPRVQQELLQRVVEAARGKPVVLVLLNGSALGLDWADRHVPAILEAWYPGEAGGAAVADVLFGNVSPAGRLPVTFYRSVEQLPPFDDYSMKGRTYRYFTGAPTYPFGHGLSYSRFVYAKLSVPKTAAVGASVPVSVEVRNAGAMPADEVVQLYVTDVEASGPVPIRALKGFRRVALRAGERRVVRFSLDERTLSLVGPDGRRVVEPGRFTIAVGGKQPGLSGTADARTTMVLTADLELVGRPKALAP
jgi:beta-glucosidase